MVLITLLSKAKVNGLNFHPECGESPVYKYKELAKAIGNNFIIFLKGYLIVIHSRMGCKPINSIYAS